MEVLIQRAMRKKSILQWIAVTCFVMIATVSVCNIAGADDSLNTSDSLLDRNSLEDWEMRMNSAADDSARTSVGVRHAWLYPIVLAAAAGTAVYLLFAVRTR